MQPPSSSSLSLFLSFYAHEADVLLSRNDFVDCFFFEISTRKILFFFAFFFGGQRRLVQNQQLGTIVTLDEANLGRTTHDIKRKKKKERKKKTTTNPQRSGVLKKNTLPLLYFFLSPSLVFSPLLSLYPTRTQRHKR